MPISVAESDATARPSIATFQTLFAGKTVQAGAPGRVGAPPPGGGRGRRAGVAAAGRGVGGDRRPGGWLAALRGSVAA